MALKFRWDAFKKLGIVDKNFNQYNYEPINYSKKSLASQINQRN